MREIVPSGYDFGNRPTPGCIEGFKGLDADFDGVYESGEPGQAGVTIYLDLNKNGQHDEGEPVAVTDASGQFCFCGLTPGRYVVRERTDDGFEQVLPADGKGIIVDVDPGQTVTGLLFVNGDLHGCLEGLKWLDRNGNRARDAGEPSTWTQADAPDTAGVDETGWLTLCGVRPGTYTVREVSPAGYDPRFPGPDGHVATVLSGKRVSGLQFGNIPQSPFIEGWRFDDCNRNGRRDRNRHFSVNVATRRYHCHKCHSQGNQLERRAAVINKELHPAMIDLCHALGREIPWIRRW